MPAKKDPLVSFKEKILMADNGCWVWTACRSRDGYGVMNVGLAHRFSWKAFRGPIPKSMYVLHKCDNPSCVNPDHLFIGTQFDNMRDMKAKGREAYRKGEHHPRAKLTEQQAISIIHDPREHKVIAREYGIRSTHVGKIKRGVMWPHLHSQRTKAPIAGIMTSVEQAGGHR